MNFSFVPQRCKHIILRRAHLFKVRLIKQQWSVFCNTYLFVFTNSDEKQKPLLPKPLDSTPQFYKYFCSQQVLSSKDIAAPSLHASSTAPTSSCFYLVLRDTYCNKSILQMPSQPVLASSPITLLAQPYFLITVCF